MTKETRNGLVRAHVWLYEKDVEHIRAKYGDGQSESIGFSFAIRQLLHAAIVSGMEPQSGVEPPPPTPRRVCIAVGCDNDQTCRGYCSSHYRRLQYVHKKQLSRGTIFPLMNP